MANFLPMAMYLMQAAQGGGTDGPLIPPAPPGYPANTEPLSMDAIPQQAMAASAASSTIPQDIQGEEEITSKGLDKIEHKGMFGVKGTLRDILGLLGDTYLMANGRDPYYSPIRRQERFSDALSGGYQNDDSESFANNPLLALQRVAEAGFGKEYTDLYQDFTKTEQAKAAAALNEARLSRQEARDDQLAKQGDVTAQKHFIEGVLARLYSGVSDPASLAIANQWASSKLEPLGLSGFRLPESVEEARRFGIQPYQQQRLEDFDVGLGIQQQNANANSQRAAVARPRADSRAEIIERIGNKPPEKRTPGEQAAYENAIATGRGNGRGRRTGGGGATSSGGAPSAPPRKKGDAYRTSDGRIWRSPDGKSWQ